MAVLIAHSPYRKIEKVLTQFPDFPLEQSERYSTERPISRESVESKKQTQRRKSETWGGEVRHRPGINLREKGGHLDSGESILVAKRPEGKRQSREGNSKVGLWNALALRQNGNEENKF